MKSRASCTSMHNVQKWKIIFMQLLIVKQVNFDSIYIAHIAAAIVNNS